MITTSLVSSGMSRLAMVRSILGLRALVSACLAAATSALMQYLGTVREDEELDEDQGRARGDA